MRPAVKARKSPCNEPPCQNAVDREQIEGQLQRLGIDSIDLWVQRGFNVEEASVEDTAAAVKVKFSSYTA